LNIFITHSRIIKDVPVFVWSQNSELESLQISESVSSETIGNYIYPLISRLHPEVVVLYIESTLRTSDVSRHIDNTNSVFSILEKITKKKFNYYSL